MTNLSPAAHALDEKLMQRAVKAEYDALVMQVASWCMRSVARDEYTPLAQLLKQFCEDVESRT